MPRTVVVDAGPLVALFNRRDADHHRVVSFLREYHDRLFSTLAVVTEVMHVLEFSHNAQQGFLQWMSTGAVERIELSDEDFRRTIELHSKYADRPMDFADATLVAVAERLGIRAVLTLDSDFRIYRYRGRYSFQLPLLDNVDE